MLSSFLLIDGQLTLDATLKVLLRAVGFAASVIAAAFAAIPLYREWRDRRKLLTQFFTSEQISRATTCYIRPHCSQLDLSERVELRNLLAPEDEGTISKRMDLFKKIDHFCKRGSSHRHMLLLADSGMGKTSFLLNYYFLNSRRKLRNRHRIAVIPLAEIKYGNT